MTEQDLFLIWKALDTLGYGRAANMEERLEIANPAKAKVVTGLNDLGFTVDSEFGQLVPLPPPEPEGDEPSPPPPPPEPETEEPAEAVAAESSEESGGGFRSRFTGAKKKK
jgi:hypothetical protein